MDCYIGTKVVQAEPMDEFAFMASTGRLRPVGAENRDGYKVVYDDGYTSWSPREVFVRCYRSITRAEVALVLGS